MGEYDVYCQKGNPKEDKEIEAPRVSLLTDFLFLFVVVVFVF